MKKLFPIKHQLLNLIGLFLWVLVVFSSCSKIESSMSSKDGMETDTNFVSEAEAKTMALEQMTHFKRSSGKKPESTNASISTLTAVKTKTQLPSFYIVNYSSGGFAIISSDKRLYPILAFSDVNTFNLKSDNIPSGLLAWLKNVDETVIGLRNGSLQASPYSSPTTKTMWKPLSGKKILEIDPNQFSNCTEAGATSVEYETIGPFLSTNWNQIYGFNDSVPNIGCPNGALPPTGCVATAMAQIMRYYQKPTSYNWSSMANNYSTPETARLMKNIGYAVNMDYGCDGSSAITEQKAPPAFTNNFGYASANYYSYNYNTVESEIRSNHPVILTGGSNGGWWIFGSYEEGHAWVCDGLRVGRYYECRETMTPFSPNPILTKQITFTTLYFNMNWGWGGNYNGYYAYNNFNPGSYTFNYQPGMVVNIRP